MIRLEELEKLGNLELLARQVVEGFITGLHKSPFHGFSVEFAEHRLYNAGESTRHIDWKLFARSEKLFIKRYEEETNLRCQLVIDTSSSMYFPEKGINKIKFSFYAAAAIMHLLKRQRDAFGICLLNNRIEYRSEIKSSSTHYRQLLRVMEQELQKTPGQKTTELAMNLDLLAEQMHRRSLVIIFSDMMQTFGREEELVKSLQHLKFNKHEVILFHVQDKNLENDFNFSNRPYVMVDPETGEKLKVLPNEVREQYLAAQEKFKKELKYRCAQLRVDLVEADAGRSFEQVLIPFLIKREKLL
jgi:uncharacterized protein (DUF58 family)